MQKRQTACPVAVENCDCCEYLIYRTHASGQDNRQVRIPYRLQYRLAREAAASYLPPLYKSIQPDYFVDAKWRTHELDAYPCAMSVQQYHVREAQFQVLNAV